MKSRQGGRNLHASLPGLCLFYVTRIPVVAPPANFLLSLRDVFSSTKYLPAHSLRGCLSLRACSRMPGKIQACSRVGRARGNAEASAGLSEASGARLRG